MTQFRKMFKEAYKEVTLKEWDDENDLMYGSNDTGEIVWTLNIPMNKEIADILLKNNVVKEEDLYTNGVLDPTYEDDFKIEYYHDDEELSITHIYLNVYADDPNNKWVDITNLLSPEYKEKVEDELTFANPMDIKFKDPTEDLRKDYYNNLL